MRLRAEGRKAVLVAFLLLLILGASLGGTYFYSEFMTN